MGFVILSCKIYLGIVRLNQCRHWSWKLKQPVHNHERVQDQEGRGKTLSEIMIRKRSRISVFSLSLSGLIIWWWKRNLMEFQWMKNDPLVTIRDWLTHLLSFLSCHPSWSAIIFPGLLLYHSHRLSYSYIVWRWWRNRYYYSKVGSRQMNEIILIPPCVN